jgi:hypothetical protein
MANCTAQILKAVTSTSVGAGSLEQPSSASRRIVLTEFLCGSDAATLGTSNFRWEFIRSTSAATGTLVSISVLDTADVVVSANVRSNLSANGTLLTGAPVNTIAVSQQATFRWVAAPGKGIIIPATNLAGIHFMTPVCGNTPSVAGQINYEEW